MFNLVYLYLLAPLHTGGASQEGNLVGIARESHTDLPYVPSSTIRGRLRSITPESNRNTLWGNTLEDVSKGIDNNLRQGGLWVGDASILWLPVPSLSHGVIWVSCPMLLQRWRRLCRLEVELPAPYSCSFNANKPVYLKDAILKSDEIDEITEWDYWLTFLPGQAQDNIHSLIILPNQHCTTLMQMSLWRQVKVKLDEHKEVDGGFRFEEAIPPDTLMYFPWGTTTDGKDPSDATAAFQQLLLEKDILQFGGQESLGRGFVEQWS